MLKVIINNRQRRVKIEKELEKALACLAGEVLRAHGEEAEVGVTLVGKDDPTVEQGLPGSMRPRMSFPFPAEPENPKPAKNRNSWAMW